MERNSGRGRWGVCSRREGRGTLGRKGFWVGDGVVEGRRHGGTAKVRGERRGKSRRDDERR